MFKLYRIPCLFSKRKKHHLHQKMQGVFLAPFAVMFSSAAALDNYILDFFNIEIIKKETSFPAEIAGCFYIELRNEVQRMITRKENKVFIDNRCFLTRADKERYLARLKWIYLTQVMRQCEVFGSQYVEVYTTINSMSLCKKEDASIAAIVESAFDASRSANSKLWKLFDATDCLVCPNDVIPEIVHIIERAQKLAKYADTILDEINDMMYLYQRTDYAEFFDASFSKDIRVKWADLQWLSLINEFANTWSDYQSDLDVSASRTQFLKVCARLLQEKNAQDSENYPLNIEALAGDRYESLRSSLLIMGKYLNVNFLTGIQETCTGKILSQLKEAPVGKERETDTLIEGNVGNGIGYKMMDKLYKAIRKAQHPPMPEMDLPALGYALITHSMSGESEEQFRKMLSEFNWFDGEALDLADYHTYEEEWSPEWNDEEEIED